MTEAVRGRLDEDPRIRTMTRQGTTALVATIGIGILACLLGVATAVAYGDHLMGFGAGDDRANVWPSTVAELGGRAIVVIALALVCAVSTLIAAVAFVVRGSPGAARWVVVPGAIVHVGAMALVLAVAWRPGWYYILDPASSSPARPFVAAAGVQGVAWIVSAVLALRAKNPATEPTRAPTS